MSFRAALPSQVTAGHRVSCTPTQARSCSTRTKSGSSTNQPCQIDPATLVLDVAKAPTAGVSVLLEGLPDDAFIASFGVGSDSNVWVTTNQDPESTSRGFELARISVTAGALRFTPFAIPTLASTIGGPWAPVAAQGGGQWVMDRSGTLHKLTLAP